MNNKYEVKLIDAAPMVVEGNIFLLNNTEGFLPSSDDLKVNYFNSNIVEYIKEIKE